MTTPTAEESRALLAQLAGHTTGPWVIAAHLRAALDREAAALAERDAALAEADRLREAAQRLLPYLDWQMEEGGDFHPTMPSAAEGLRDALASEPGA